MQLLQLSPFPSPIFARPVLLKLATLAGDRDERNSETTVHAG